MGKPTVYLETTVVGHLASRPHPDLAVSARQLASQAWWQVRDRFQICISQVVVEECGAGDRIAARERAHFLDGLSILEITQDATLLAKSLLTSHAIPKTEPRDALHIALSASHGIQYLLTWNFRHIANAVTRSLIESVCRDAGFVPPIICTPDELLGD